MAITNSKQAADFLNKRAPKGESLAFINESEARLLKANGGMGLPLPNTGGVPVYGFWGDAWEAAKNWGKEAVKNVDFGEWVDIGTKAWDTYAKYKSEKGQNEADKATYDKYLQDTADYERAAEIAIAENLTPMAVAKPALTKADITDFTLVKDGGIIGLKNGGRPGYMMGDMVMEETTMAAAPADVKESLNSIPPEMQAISQELFQKAVEELTEQELQMLMAYMQKAAMETATAQAPMEEEMMVSETMMAANGGIMNNKRGFVDGPGGYAGELVEPGGGIKIFEDGVPTKNFQDDRIVPEEFALEPENRPAFPQTYDESEMIVTEPVGLNSASNEVSKEEQYLIEGGVEFEKQLMEIYNAFQQRFPNIENSVNYSFEDMIAELQMEGVLEVSDGKLIAMAEGLRNITPASIARTKQRIARGDTQYGNLPNEVMMNSGGGAGIEALRKVRPDVVEKMGFNKGGGPGIEALRKVRPDVVETMGFNMGGRARYADGPMDPSTDAEEGMNLEPNDMNLGNEMASLDSLTEEYNKYVFEMEEMGLVPMGIEQFRDQAIAEGKMAKMDYRELIYDASRDNFANDMFGKDYSDLTPEQVEEVDIIIEIELGKKQAAPEKQMASAPDASSELNDAALNVYGVPLNELSDEQIETLKELQMNRSMPTRDKGIMMAARGGRAMYAYGQGPVMNQGIGTMMANDGMEMLDMGGMEKDYRFNGGFVPMGEYEKKDDVPARLSKNEFVFTADAVRAAGGGSIKKGAQKMYDTMKNLEANV